MLCSSQAFCCLGPNLQWGHFPHKFLLLAGVLFSPLWRRRRITGQTRFRLMVDVVVVVDIITGGDPGGGSSGRAILLAGSFLPMCSFRRHISSHGSHDNISSVTSAWLTSGMGSETYYFPRPPNWAFQNLEDRFVTSELGRWLAILGESSSSRGKWVLKDYRAFSNCGRQFAAFTAKVKKGLPW